jgi:hypothetical protein
MFKGKGLKPVTFKLWVNRAHNVHRPTTTVPSGCNSIAFNAVVPAAEGPQPQLPKPVSF